VKKSIDITLSTIHVGSEREVVTLAIDGKDPAAKYLSQLFKKDRENFNNLQTRIHTVANYDFYENDHTFRHVGEGVFEFKRNNPRLLRLYAFYDEIDGIGRLIICTNGGDKNQQSEDINKAKSIKSRYFQAKQIPTTTISLE
jgi:putative component of toxin-antitoxin plasmid stabilization module